jgi:hypothetical protein
MKFKNDKNNIFIILKKNKMIKINLSILIFKICIIINYIYLFIFKIY